MASEYQTVLRFDTQDPEFARGFEAGRIWRVMSDVADGSVLPEELEGQVFHAVNAEMIMRMLEAHGLDGWRAEFLDDHAWMRLRR